MRYGDSRTMEYRPSGSKKRKPNSKVQARKEWIRNTIARSEKGSRSKKKGMMKQMGMMKPARISPVAPKKVGGQDRQSQDRQRIMEAIKARRDQSY